MSKKTQIETVRERILSLIAKTNEEIAWQECCSDQPSEAKLAALKARRDALTEVLLIHTPVSNPFPVGHRLNPRRDAGDKSVGGL